jgi:hypothetical protein
MIFHAASWVALFADQVQQAPVVIQSVQTTPEAEWKWWLKLIAEILGPLLSTAGSIYVAWMVFHWQGRKDREQWVRDQKREEWKRLIQLAAEYEELMPLGKPGSSAVEAVRNDVLPLCDRIRRLVSEALFIAPVLSADEIRSRLSQIMEETDWAIGRIDTFPQSSLADQAKLGTPVENAFEIRRGLQELHAKLLSLAQKDLSLD